MRVVSVLLMVLGVLVGGVGGGAAVLVGPDDVLETPVARVDLGSAPAAVTSPRLLAYSDATVQLSASSPDGPVFVGLAHPVDVADWLGGSPHWTLESVDTGGVHGAPAAGRKGAQAPRAPAGLRFWSTVGVGAGKRTISVGLDGAPVQAVVVPPEGSGRLDVRMGLVLPHAFVAAVGVAGVGIVLVVLGVLLRRRSRRGPFATPVAGSGAAGPPPDDAAPGRVVRLTAAVVAVPVLLGGCSALPREAEPWDPATVTKPAASADGFRAALADYDRRNNAAMASTSTSHDPTAWKGVDTGLLLGYDRFDTRRRAVGKAEPSTTTLEYTLESLYATSQSTYPMSVVAATTDRTTNAGGKDDGSTTQLTVWSRERAAAPWKQAASVTLPDQTAPPSARAPGDASTPSSAATERAGTVAQELLEYLGNGRKPRSVAVTTELRDLRSGASVRRDPAIRHRLTVRYVNDTQDQTGPGGSVHTVATADGTLVVVSYLARDSFSLSDGTVSWGDDYGKIVGQTGERHDIARDIGVTVAVLVPESGRGHVLATTWNTVL